MMNCKQIGRERFGAPDMLEHKKKGFLRYNVGVRIHFDPVHTMSCSGLKTKNLRKHFMGLRMIDAAKVSETTPTDKTKMKNDKNATKSLRRAKIIFQHLQTFKNTRQT